MAAKRSHHLSALVRAYADGTGIALRTAQLHAKKADPRWIAFAGRNGVNLNPPLMEVAVTVESADGEPAREDGPIEHEMEREHRELWRATITQAKRATEGGDVQMAAALGKIAEGNLAAFEKARRLRINRDIEDRELIPAGEWHSFGELVRRIAAMITGLDRELADKVNPENPGVAGRAIREWLENRWNPALDALPA